jgi:hypothetical protein
MVDIDEIREFLIKYGPIKSPVVKPNKNKKTISVASAFNLNRIPIKIIATYHEWIEFEKIILRDDYIKFEFIRSNIRPKKNLSILKQFWDEDPLKFTNELYELYICEANAQNPIHELSKKPRRLVYQGIDKRTMYEIKIAAKHIYVFLKYWFSKPKKSYPPLLQEFLNTPNIVTRSAIAATMEIIDSYYENWDADKIDDTKVFYDKYITHKKYLKLIKEIYERINYLPINPETKEIAPSVRPLLKIISDKK